jgi:hypothetical protein
MTMLDLNRLHAGRGAGRVESVRLPSRQAHRRDAISYWGPPEVHDQDVAASLGMLEPQQRPVFCSRADIDLPDDIALAVRRVRRRTDSRPGSFSGWSRMSSMASPRRTGRSSSASCGDPGIGLPEGFGHALAAPPPGAGHRGLGFGDDPFDARHDVTWRPRAAVGQSDSRAEQNLVGESYTLGSAMVTKRQPLSACSECAETLQGLAERRPRFRRRDWQCHLTAPPNMYE